MTYDRSSLLAHHLRFLDIADIVHKEREEFESFVKDVMKGSKNSDGDFFRYNLEFKGERQLEVYGRFGYTDKMDLDRDLKYWNHEVELMWCCASNIPENALLADVEPFNIQSLIDAARIQLSQIGGEWESIEKSVIPSKEF